MAPKKDKAQDLEPAGISLRERFEAHKKAVVGVAALVVVILVGVILYATFRAKAREERWTELMSTVLYNPYSAGPTLDRLEGRAGSDILPHILLQRAVRSTSAQTWDTALADLTRLQTEYRDSYLNSLPASERYSLGDELRRLVESESKWQSEHTYASPTADTKRVALVETSLGAFWIGFFPELAPEHVALFINGAKTGTYNGTSVTLVKAAHFEFGGDASRDDDPFNDGSAPLEQPVSPEGSRFKVRPERGMVSSCAIEGGESPTRLMVTVQEDREMDKRQTIFGRALTDRYPHMETLDAIAQATTYGTTTEQEYKDTAKYGPVADHPVAPIRIERVSIWSEGRIEDGHEWDTSAVVKPEPKAPPPGDKPADATPPGGDKPADAPADATPPGEKKPADEKPSDPPAEDTPPAGTAPKEPADNDPPK
jgi:peptidyl-prolyl cis-trans isomerase B (cyclophilin B)